MDAIVVGSGTARRDDPHLIARPPGARVATRLVFDSLASLGLTSQLVATSREAPVLIAVGPDADAAKLDALQSAGVEIYRDSVRDPTARLANLWRELGRRRMTNVLVEGGSRFLGALFAQRLIDEVHAFIGPTLIGGGSYPPLAGIGVERIADGLRIPSPTIEVIDQDVYIHGRL
jgi:diaminohydroxyphosphoribosylaminopyrimidine deaminase/5-amino-6-(5-phosphoribosylamino)uracil reductase